MKFFCFFCLVVLSFSCVKKKSVLIKSEKKIKLSKYNVATFAGGCFWCLESDFEKHPGVIDAVSGYTGGRIKNPTYEQVSNEQTGHYEAVKVYYDKNFISYIDLLEIFWRSVNPTDVDGQFIDRGDSYRPAIFYENNIQQKLSKQSIKKLIKSKRYQKDILVPILKTSIFYKAEEYHQDYYKKNFAKYKYYRFRSGRDQYLEKIWGDELAYKIKNNSFTDIISLRKKLTKMQFYVTQEDGTEPPFNNKFWDHKEEGIYVDVVSGEPLFSSFDKFKSGTGWPSFTRPLELHNIVEKKDRKLFTSRVEVRSKRANSHLGHVFKDGPDPTGLRYCINSASLRFVGKKDLEAEGLQKYKDRFK